MSVLYRVIMVRTVIGLGWVLFQDRASCKFSEYSYSFGVGHTGGGSGVFFLWFSFRYATKWGILDGIFEK